MGNAKSRTDWITCRIKSIGQIIWRKNCYAYAYVVSNMVSVLLWWKINYIFKHEQIILIFASVTRRNLSFTSSNLESPTMTSTLHASRHRAKSTEAQKQPLRKQPKGEQGLFLQLRFIDGRVMRRIGIK